MERDVTKCEHLGICQDKKRKCADCPHRRIGWGVTVTRILDLLQMFGPLTRADICEHLQGKHDAGNVSAILTRMRKSTPKNPKRIYIMRYIYEAEYGTRRYPRAVYALGDKPCVKKPKPQTKENRRRYRAKLKSLSTTNSVFNLGLTVRQIRETRRSA